MKFYRETEFQETEIGKIPKEWKVTKLGEIAKIIMGQSPPSETYNKDGVGMPFLQGKMEFGRIYPSPSMYTTKPIKIAEPNDILISVRAPVGDVNITPFKLCIGRGLAAIRFNMVLASNLFYFYYLQWSKNRLEIIGKGSTFKAITIEDLKDFKVTYPPYNEQQKLAEILSTVDRAIEDVDKTIARLERLKKALMGELLTGRIRVKEVDGKLTFYRETEFQETDIGKIPIDWKIKKLGDLLEFAHGKRPEMLLTEGIPIYGAGGFYGYTNTYLVNKPAILVIARVGKGSVGKVYLVRGSVWITDNAIYGYSKDPNGVTTTYAYYRLIFDKNWVEKYARRSAGGYAIITLDSLKNLKIPVPTISEQVNIVNVVSLFIKVIELYHEEKRRLEHLKRGLMDLLLTGKISVRGD